MKSFPLNSDVPERISDRTCVAQQQIAFIDDDELSPRVKSSLPRLISEIAMASFAKEILEFITALEGLRISAYVDTASFTILVYDYILTFEDERTLIWPGQWTVTKVLFLFTRYLPFIDLSIPVIRHASKDLSPKACELSYQSSIWLINVGFLTAELILLIRTWAIWERSRLITVILGIWATLNLVAEFVVMGFFMTALGFTSQPHGLPDCLLTSGNLLIRSVWIILMVYEAGIIVLLAIKGSQLRRDLGSSALYRALFRNGTIFCVYVFALSVANVIIISALPHRLASLLASIESVTHAILAQRLLLTLRKTVYGPEPGAAGRLDTLKINERLGAIGTFDTERGTNSSQPSSMQDDGVPE
ncbi:hypothetical protein A7U60_g3843 [Sanghuangporus baumii]|uniref:DUF6533 domain-containing protein n=1 Tax=Sanghuangporus baumii TaxID=108892 RepID=A0A9Q5HZR3_SANBA|nr:hypothetical protein A7U60_g3843 [Sanghuangporus baumii]